MDCPHPRRFTVDIDIDNHPSSIHSTPLHSPSQMVSCGLCLLEEEEISISSLAAQFGMMEWEFARSLQSHSANATGHCCSQAMVPCADVGRPKVAP